MERIRDHTDGYKTVKPSKNLRSFVERNKKLVGPLCRTLKLKAPRFFYYSDDDSSCAIYCNGSMKHPVIGLNALFCDELDLDLGRGLHSTIVHELLHAFLETAGLPCDEYKHPERKVETIARDYRDGMIDEERVREKLLEIVETEKKI